MKNVEQMLLGDPGGKSTTFKKFIKDVADAKTKFEESLVMQQEIETLKKEIKEPSTSPNIQHERLVRLVYIHMLGYNAEFGVIDAIKFAQHSSVFYKRVGYLVSSLLLDVSSELSLLMCCSLQKDLNSDSVVEQSMALTVICQLMGKDTISTFMPTIIKKLAHPKEIIRKKAVDVLYQFLCEQPDVTYDERYQLALCDPDAGVMVSTLPIYLKLSRERPDEYRHMVKAFTSILTQIVEGRLHASFNYHTFPAPWAQVYLLQILQALGTNNKEASESMGHVLHLVLGRSTGKMSTPQAADAATSVLYQAAMCVLSIYPDQDLIMLVTRNIDKLLNTSPNHAYLGLRLLHKLCEGQPSIGCTLIPLAEQYTTHPCLLLRESAVRAMAAGITSENFKQSTDVLLNVLIDQKNPEELIKMTGSAIADVGRHFAPTPDVYVELLIETLRRTTMKSTEPCSMLINLIDFCASSKIKTFELLLPEEQLKDHSQLVWLSIWAFGRYDGDYSGAHKWVGEIGNLSDGEKLWLLDSLTVLVLRLGPLPASLTSPLAHLCSHPSPILRQMSVELLNVSKIEGVLGDTGTDAISELCESLSKLETDTVQSVAHKHFLAKFRKRTHTVPEREDYLFELDNRQPSRPTGGGDKPVTGWVSYHEHITEDVNNPSKVEPPVDQPALQNKRWGNKPPKVDTNSSSARC